MKHFYVYYSYEEYGRGYIGKRECICTPEEDIKYFGSFEDKTFKPTQKIILETFNNRKEAYIAESKLHHFYDVKHNPHFANRANQYLNRNDLFKIKELKINDIKFKNNFVQLVKESASIRQILLKLNLKETGGNYESIHSWMKLLNLDNSHFTGQRCNKNKKLGDRITEEQKEKSHYKYFYTITNPSGETFKTNNLNRFCRDNNLNRRNMWMVSVNRLKHNKNWKVYREDIKSIK